MCGDIPPSLVDKVWGDGDATELPCGDATIVTNTAPPTTP